MPEEVARYYQNLCESGKLSPRWKAFKKERKLTCTELGEAVASIVSNKLKSKKDKAMGGDVEDGFFDDETDIVYGGSNSNWVKIAGPDTTYKRRNGSTIKIDELAHLSRYKDWVNPNIKIHLDHKEDKAYDLNIKDVKYDPLNGLWILPDPTDNEIREGLFTGKMRPSLEVRYNIDTDITNGVLTDYIPIGLGLMTNPNQAREPTAGPSNPPTDALSYAQGGNNMADKTPEEILAEKKAKEEDDKKQKELDAKALEEKAKKEREEAEAKAKRDAMTKDELEKSIRTQLEAEYKKKIEEMAKSQSKEKALEDELKSQYLRNIPEGIIDATASLEDIKRTAVMYNKLNESLGKTVKTQIPELIKGGKLDITDPNAPKQMTKEDIENIKKKAKEIYKYRVPPNPDIKK